MGTGIRDKAAYVDGSIGTVAPKLPSLGIRRALGWACNIYMQLANRQTRAAQPFLEARACNDARNAVESACGDTTQWLEPQDAV